MVKDVPAGKSSEKSGEFMIRFSCSACQQLLRAPAELAGKKGRCARCGQINEVPAAMPVDVSRAPAPSPFRSTADLEPRRPIEGIVMVEEGRFLATAPPDQPIAPAVDEICEEIALRLEEVIEPPDMTAAQSDVVPVPPRRFSMASETHEWSEPAHEYHSNLDLRNAGVKRALIWALIVGAVIGFVLGVAASKWIF